MGEKLAVVGDKNDHGNGDLQTPPQTKWTINGKLVCTVDTVALPDLLGHIPSLVNPSTGQNKWTIGGKAIHRHNDSRYCGGKTIATGQTKFTVG